MISRTDVKKCGTCHYWTGKREPTFNKSGEPRVHIVDDVGQCENSTSIFMDKLRKQGLNCCKYSKWTEIL